MQRRNANYGLIAIAAGILANIANHATAQDIRLFDFAFNIDGILTANPSKPGFLNDAGFSYSTGLGTFTIEASTAGKHYIGVFLDHELDEQVNGFTNETGGAFNTPSVGQSWEIDEPGFVTGDIYNNLTAGALDNKTTTGGPPYDDVSMALAWSLNLGPGESALATFSMSDSKPTSGFYLQQSDTDSGSVIYFSSSLKISGRPIAAVDAGTTAQMLMVGIIPMAFLARRLKVKA